MLQSMRSAAKYIWIAVAVFFVGGFLLLDTSGLLGGGGGITNGTTVASVNGRDIPYATYANATQTLAQQEEQQRGRALSLDERRQTDSLAFEQIVSDILLEQEIRRRGITVTDEEIVQAAQFSPPPQLLQSPELQTEGRFDPEKYRRFLQSPSARQTGLLAQLEQYYRSEIPRQKLFLQVASDVYVTDQRLWQIYKDGHDSAQVSAVAFKPELIPDSTVAVSEQEVRAYFEKNRANFVRPGRAALSVIAVPRTITAADSAATRTRVATIRQELLAGASFEEVARRESADSGSAANGGSLGNAYVRGQGFVKPFEDAAYALQPGQLSEPVLTQFGYHLIRLDSRRGDTLALRHILVPIAQSDSSATGTDRRADQLTQLAGTGEGAGRFDAAAKQLGLPVRRGVAFEGGRLFIDNQYVPSAAAWAFDGASPGDVSELFDSPEGYYLVRLDSLTEGGQSRLETVSAEIRGYLARQKKLDRLAQQAAQLASRAKASSLEAAAQAAGQQVQKTATFTRVNAVPLLGQFNQAIGAAFALPVGVVGAPVRTDEGVYVMRVDRRAESNRAAFEAQKAEQRRQITQALRSERVRDFLEDLRKSAELDDNRRQVFAASRRQDG